MTLSNYGKKKGTLVRLSYPQRLFMRTCRLSTLYFHLEK